MYTTLEKNHNQSVLESFHNFDRHQLQRYAWGSSLILSGGAGFVVKEYFLMPGGEIHPHCHMESTENWTILEGAAMLTIDHEKIYMTMGDSHFVRLGEYHSLRNFSLHPMHAFMVQCGGNLSIEDVYIK